MKSIKYRTNVFWQIISDDSVWMFSPNIQLSTVRLPYVFDEFEFESCVFFDNGNSEVVKRYKTQIEAIEGHTELEKKYGLKRCINY